MEYFKLVGQSPLKVAIFEYAITHHPLVSLEYTANLTDMAK
jgi:hypothetical protein